MRPASYITIAFFACLFVYNQFGDYTKETWSAFYYISLGLYLFSLNLILMKYEPVKVRRHLLIVACAYWLSVVAFEIVGLVSGKYSEIISKANLLISSAIIIMIGIVLILTLLYHDKRDKR